MTAIVTTPRWGATSVSPDLLVMGGGHISIIVCMQYAYKFNSEFSMAGKAYHRHFKLRMLKAISSCIKILYEICIAYIHIVAYIRIKNDESLQPKYW